MWCMHVWSQSLCHWCKQVAYSAAAAAARLHYEQRKPPLLKGESLHIVEPDAQTPQTASRVAALNRTATAHGAQVRKQHCGCPVNERIHTSSTVLSSREC